MQEAANPCKGCRESVQVAPESIAAMIAQVEATRETVSDQVYHSRLQQCLNCEHLQYGTTCMICGCIVQVKAKIKTSTCPDPDHSRWDA